MGGVVKAVLHLLLCGLHMLVLPQIALGSGAEVGENVSVSPRARFSFQATTLLISANI